MPGISGPSVTVSLTGPCFAAHRSSFACTTSRSVHHLKILSIALVFLIWNCAAWPQTGDITDVHITPRAAGSPAAPAAATAPASAVASPDVPTPSVGLKSTGRTYRTGTELVLVPVTVTDPMNRLVTGLERENFAVAEGSQNQQIRTFSSEDAPLSLGVIFDMSGSMGNKIDKSKQAVIEFFKTANPDDEFFMIGFSDKPELICDFTNSIEDIQSRLVFANAKGRTALLDAIYMGIKKMKQAHHEKKALLIISDGGDNRSRYTDSEIKSLVKEADVEIYSIGLFDNSPATSEERYGPYLLNEISDVTGGRMFRVDDPNELADVATKIGVELRNQYVLGYRPTNAARDGKWRKIKVKLVPPKGLPPLTVHAKTGYYAPTE
jgi:Ca-activated chloride channel family protein